MVIEVKMSMPMPMQSVGTNIYGGSGWDKRRIPSPQEEE